MLTTKKIPELEFHRFKMAHNNIFNQYNITSYQLQKNDLNYELNSARIEPFEIDFMTGLPMYHMENRVKVYPLFNRYYLNRNPEQDLLTQGKEYVINDESFYPGWQIKQDIGDKDQLIHTIKVIKKQVKFVINKYNITNDNNIIRENVQEKTRILRNLKEENITEIKEKFFDVSCELTDLNCDLIEQTNYSIDGRLFLYKSVLSDAEKCIEIATQFDDLEIKSSCMMDTQLLVSDFAKPLNNQFLFSKDDIGCYSDAQFLDYLFSNMSLSLALEAFLLFH